MMARQALSETAYASDFFGIPDTLIGSPDLADAMCLLIATQPIAGKVTEGGGRLEAFRLILGELARGGIGFFEAISRVDSELPPRSSGHVASNSVFARGWAERLVRTQFSRFYSHAVLDRIISNGGQVCFIPHSRAEIPGKGCSLYLAGREHDARAMRDCLIEAYARGRWAKSVRMVPHHPHCTHVVVPVRVARTSDPDNRISNSGRTDQYT